MTAITDTNIETVAVPVKTRTTEASLISPMLVSAVRDHALSWLDNSVRFAVGALVAWGMLSLTQWPDLTFLAAFSAASAWLYIANLADVERYRDAVLFVVPALFIWVVLSLGADNPVLVGLSLFTHVFLSFVGAFAHHSGTLRMLRFWFVLLGFQLVLLIYLVSSFTL